MTNRWRRSILTAVGDCAGQQLVKDDPQRVNIRKWSDRAAVNLLRTGVGGRERRPCAVVCGIVAEKLANTEIEQFWDAIGTNQDVSGFDVAVDDEIAMCVV